MHSAGTEALRKPIPLYSSIHPAAHLFFRRLRLGWIQQPGRIEQVYAGGRKEEGERGIGEGREGGGEYTQQQRGIFLVFFLETVLVRTIFPSSSSLSSFLRRRVGDSPSSSSSLVAPQEKGERGGRRGERLGWCHDGFGGAGTATLHPPGRSPPARGMRGRGGLA